METYETSSGDDGVLEDAYEWPPEKVTYNVAEGSLFWYIVGPLLIGIGFAVVIVLNARWQERLVQRHEYLNDMSL